MQLATYKKHKMVLDSLMICSQYFGGCRLKRWQKHHQKIVTFHKAHKFGHFRWYSCVHFLEMLWNSSKPISPKRDLVMNPMVGCFRKITQTKKKRACLNYRFNWSQARSVSLNNLYQIMNWMNLQHWILPLIFPQHPGNTANRASPQSLPQEFCSSQYFP